jgi:hypothetical protein
MRQSRQRQRGLALMVMVVLIAFVALGILISKTGELAASVGRQFSATNDTQSNIQRALISFAGAYGRLPCPAIPIGAANPGWPDDVTPLALPASSTCAQSYGVVPWNALGLSREQVMDEWGRLISYRVYDGPIGLTQDMGASALNCDTSNFNVADGSTTQRVEPTASGLCDNVDGKHHTLRSDFINFTNFGGTTPTFSKGLNVHDFGTTANVANVSNVAYVLVSHGPSGLGGYLPPVPPGLGTRMPMPASDARDYDNTRTSPAFFIKQAASASGVAAGTTGHYDDIVSYLTIADLLKLANRDARDWPEDSMPSFNALATANMTSPSTDPLNPHFMTSATPGQGFTAADGGTAVEGGGGGSGTFASCLWWPLKLRVVSGASRNFIAASVEFAAVDISAGENFPGFTLGFLSGTDAAGAPINSTCGTTAVTTTATNTADPKFIKVASTTGIQVGMNAYGAWIDSAAKVVGINLLEMEIELDIATTGSVGTVSFADSRRIRRDLGWAGGTLASYTDRFAVEVDSNIDVGAAGPPVVPTASDPTRPHLAVDYTGVTHGTDATSCATTGSGLACDSEIVDFPSVSRTATGTAGSVFVTITDPLGITGVVHGMAVSGIGVGATAKVVSVSGNVLTLSVANTAALAGAITFSSISTSNFMQNGLTVFHNARVEVAPKDCVAPTGLGLISATTIVVSDSTGIASGMFAYGIGVASGATVTSVSGTTITLSIPNSAAVSGTIVFGGNSSVVTSASGIFGGNTISVVSPSGIAVGMTVAGPGVATGATVLNFSGLTVTLSANNTADFSGPVTFTPVSALTRTLVKTWTLSNAGCNENTTTCAALRNTSTKFTTDISTNRQAMQAVSCVPASTVSNAYDSLYFGITTANRESYGTPATNVKFRSLAVQMPSLP